MPWISAGASAPPPRVTVGSRVIVQDGPEEETFLIVNTELSDPLHARISEDSPLARALIGHVPGDVVRVWAPNGRREVVVLAVDAAANV
jgi:transcription elongation factor GreA